MKGKLFERLKQSLQQARAIEKGEMKPARVFRVRPQGSAVKVRGKRKRA